MNGFYPVCRSLLSGVVIGTGIAFIVISLFRGLMFLFN